MAQHFYTGTDLLLGVSGVYTSIGQLISTGGFNIANEEVDITTLADRRKQYRPGTQTDMGTEDYTVAFDPDSSAHLALTALADAATYPEVQSFRKSVSTSPAPTLWDFTGFVSGVAINGGEANERMTATFTVRYTSWPLGD